MYFSIVVVCDATWQVIDALLLPISIHLTPLLNYSDALNHILKALFLFLLISFQYPFYSLQFWVNMLLFQLRVSLKWIIKHRNSLSATAHCLMTLKREVRLASWNLSTIGTRKSTRAWSKSSTEITFIANRLSTLPCLDQVLTHL